MLQVKILEKQLLHAYIENSDLKPDTNYFLTTLAISIFDSLAELKNTNESYIKENILKAFSAKKVCKETEIENLYDAIISTEYKIEEVIVYERKLMALFFANDILPNELKNLTLALSEDAMIDVEKVTELTDKLSEKIDLIKSHGVKDHYSSADVWEKASSILSLKSQNIITKYSSGCIYLDKLLPSQSLSPGEVSIITGHPGSGKTTYIDYLANCRQFRHLPTLQIDSERTFESLTLRRTCSKLRITREQLLDPDYDCAEFEEQLKNEIAIANKNPLFEYRFPFETMDNMVTVTKFNMNYIESCIFEARKRMDLKKDSSLLCFIDLLTMMDSMMGEKGMSRADSIEKVFNELSSLSKYANCHIMGTMQQRRSDGTKAIREESDLDTLFRPTTESIKSSSGAEERTRVILGLYRKKHFLKKHLPDSPLLDTTDDILEVQILKSNDGGHVGETCDYLCEMEYNKIIPILVNKDKSKDNKIAGI